MTAEQQPDGPGVLPTGRRVLQEASDALSMLASRLDENFVRAVTLLLDCRGRVVVTGIGKSGAVARKAAATLASTGTPAFFLHPAEGVHGDLGMVTQGDLLLALSYSGETEEVLAILPSLRRIGTRLVAVTGNPGSSLAESADVVLNVAVEREACPLNLAPTTSTTAMLTLLDALAVAAMSERRFRSEDYAIFHPAGSLGRRLILRVRDLMRTGDRLALCTDRETVRDALFRITRAQAGSVLVVDDDGRFRGLLSDGDIRRLLLRDESALAHPVAGLFNEKARTITPERLVTEALHLMEQAPPIGELPVLAEDRTILGVLNLKDVARAGIL